MAKAAKPRKKAGKAAVKNGPGKFAVNQPPLDSMEDLDPRIPELDDECQSYLSEVDKKKASKQAADEHLENIGALLKENKVKFYTLNGKKFYVEPGSPSVKCVNVKQK